MRRGRPEHWLQIGIAGNFPQLVGIDVEVEPRCRSAGKHRATAHPGVEKIAADRKSAWVEDEAWERLHGRKLKVESHESEEEGAGPHGTPQVRLLDDRRWRSDGRCHD